MKPRFINFLVKYLLKFQKNEIIKEDFCSGQKDNSDIIVLGLGHYVGRIAKGLAAAGTKVTGVDFNPSILSKSKS